MNSHRFRACTLLVLFLLSIRPLSAHADRPKTDVTMNRYDLARTGANLSETVLTPANVKAGEFGRLFAYPVDGQVYAQPLVLTDIDLPGRQKMDLVFVATEHDSVYAFDAAATVASYPVWHVSFLDSAKHIGAATAGDVASGDIVPEIGITATPVIDRASGTIYVVSKTKQGDGDTAVYAQQLHALDVATGEEKAGSPVTIDATWPGTSWDADHGTIHFNPRRAHERAGLTLVNGAVILTYASHGDQQPYHGWLIGYDAKTLKQVSVFCATPVSGLGGIWMGGIAPAVDDSGNLYVTTGNAGFDITTSNFGDSLLKLAPGAGVYTVADYFEPFNQAALNAGDVDLGSGGVTLLPGSAGSTAHPHLMFTAGKEGRLYLIDRDHLGGYDPAQDHIVQSVPAARPLFGGAAYFDNTLFSPSEGRPLPAYAVADGTIGANPVKVSQVNPGGRSGSPVVSAEGSLNGIVWMTTSGVPGTLFAFDAADISRTLYASETGAIDAGVKFASPTVANGRVYVGAADALVVFGLLDKATAAPSAPTNLSTGAATARSIALTWDHDNGPVSGFRIERSGGRKRGFALAGTVARDQLHYTDRLLSSDTNYTYRIVAVNSFGDSRPSGTAAEKTAPLAVEKALADYWPLDDGGGAAARNTRGDNSPAGALVGELTWVAARTDGAALSFHGVGNAPSRVVVADDPSLRFGKKDSFTWSFWAQPLSPGTRAQALIAKARESAAWVEIGITTDGKWSFGGPAGAIIGGSAAQGWQLVTAVQDGKANLRRLYIDGALVASGPAQASDGAGGLWLGGSEGQAGVSYQGALGEARLYKRALKESEVKQIATSP